MAKPNQGAARQAPGLQRSDVAKDHPDLPRIERTSVANEVVQRIQHLLATRKIKAGEKLRLVSGGEPVLTVTHDGQGPRLKLGRRGDAPWEQTVLGRQLVAFFNEEFLPPLLAKLAAIENQFADFYANEYARHQHMTAWGPTPPGPSLPIAAGCAP